MSCQEVLEGVRRAADFDGRNADGEAGAGLLFLLVDAAEEPRDGARDHPERVDGLRRAEHRVRLAWNTIKRNECATLYLLHTRL